MKNDTTQIRQKDPKFGQIMGINVLSTTTAELLARVESFISCSRKFSIVTPNPELILASQSNQELKQALNSADLPVPDGVGLKLAIPDLNIIKGRELFLELIKLADKKGWRVFLLGGLDGEAGLAAKKLKMAGTLRDKNLKTSWPLAVKIDFHSGPVLNENGEPASEIDTKVEKDVIDKINKFNPQLLFVAFGNPKQEIWIHENLSKLNIGGAMAVGGTLRYVAGLSSLPPKWMESLGLEWLWRLIHEPKRIGRIFNAVVVFPLRVFWSRIVNL
jgi:N-acetylglucosaminyldiphosphoundecaprenol N-acetyl-beta-D-mannosaminyltransferase